MIHNNWYPRWIKVVEGKVLLSFNSIFTKRQAALEYKTAHVTESLHKKCFFLFLSLSVKFCTACRLSNHPSMFKCILVFLRLWPLRRVRPRKSGKPTSVRSEMYYTYHIEVKWRIREQIEPWNTLSLWGCYYHQK